MARIILLILIGSLPIYSLAQNLDSLDQQSIRLVDLNTDNINPRPYYVIIANDKQLGIRGDLVTEQENTIDFIDPKWIESISVFKDENAIKKYDSLGVNGVVEIVIMDEYIKQIQPEILAKFGPIND
jgi:hypothetical protein